MPKQCQFEFEIRNLPQQDIDTLVHDIRHYASDVLLADMRARYPEASIEFDELSYYPGLQTDPTSAVIACTRAINADPAASTRRTSPTSLSAASSSAIAIECSKTLYFAAGRLQNSCNRNHS